MFFASLALATLERIVWPTPSRCPYCPNTEHEHWIRWGFYERYAEGSLEPYELIKVQRYCCRITEQTFSLLPDSLLPYHYFTTAHILQWLYAMVAQRVAVKTLASREGLEDCILLHLKRRFLRVIKILRLPGRPAALDPPEFIKSLARKTGEAVVGLFRGWKELEPKYSVVGIYAR